MDHRIRNADEETYQLLLSTIATLIRRAAAGRYGPPYQPTIPPMLVIWVRLFSRDWAVVGAIDSQFTNENPLPSILSPLRWKNVRNGYYGCAISFEHDAGTCDLESLSPPWRWATPATLNFSGTRCECRRVGKVVDDHVWERLVYLFLSGSAEIRGTFVKDTSTAASLAETESSDRFLLAFFNSGILDI